MIVGLELTHTTQIERGWRRGACIRGTAVLLPGEKALSAGMQGLVRNAVLAYRGFQSSCSNFRQLRSAASPLVWSQSPRGFATGRDRGTCVFCATGPVDHPRSLQAQSFGCSQHPRRDGGQSGAPCARWEEYPSCYRAGRVGFWIWVLPGCSVPATAQAGS